MLELVRLLMTLKHVIFLLCFASSCIWSADSSVFFLIANNHLQFQSLVSSPLRGFPTCPRRCRGRHQTWLQAGEFNYQLIKFLFYIKKIYILLDTGSVDQISLDRNCHFSLDRNFHNQLTKFFDTFHLIEWPNLA